MAKANQEFAAGDFKAAASDYEELVRAGQDSPNLFYNLGNAYFRQKDFGRAILNYERALALDPRHPEAQANVRIARDEARALELTPRQLERWSGIVNANQYAVAAAVAFWLGAFAIASFVFNRRRAMIALSILSMSIFVLAVAALYQLEHGRNGSGLAVVTGTNVDARLATADTANRVLTLPAGSEIQILSRRGDWVYAALPNNLRGWLPANSAEQVRM
ncbi:MAG TPA: tetratricopeptide repeat protein [Chthoniobacterales bacterium]|nr:tetratricopeptide repeat protein [Chthoniobacterales bacterium]